MEIWRPILAMLLTTAAVSEPSRAQPQPTGAATHSVESESVEERNKAIARAFYQDLWFTQNTDRYSDYVADTYVIHYIGDDKNVVEAAVQQKKIADFLHSQGNMTGEIDFQIAEGDLVATRWQWKFEATSLPFRLLGGRDQIPIINVFRIHDGKIVEVWNHRHDVDTAMGNIPFVKGIAFGLFIALPGWLAAFMMWRRVRRLSART